MGFLEDSLIKKSFSEKRRSWKTIYFVGGLFLMFCVFYIAGYVQRKGAADFENSSGPIPNIISGSKLFFDWTKNSIINLVKINFQINGIIGVFILVSSFLIGYRLNLIKDWFCSLGDYFVKKELIFEDDFTSDKGWYLRYWEENNQNKNINRRENSKLIFEANIGDITNAEGRYGAYQDFLGITEGDLYELTCYVKAEENTTMKFQLWLHNYTNGSGSTWRTRMPASPITPKKNYQKMKVRFNGTSTKSLRVHLEATPGSGKIIVDKVKLERIIKK